jgi:hypothetical protein
MSKDVLHFETNCILKPTQGTFLMFDLLIEVELTPLVLERLTFSTDSAHQLFPRSQISSSSASEALGHHTDIVSAKFALFVSPSR